MFSVDIVKLSLAIQINPEGPSSLVVVKMTPLQEKIRGQSQVTVSHRMYSIRFHKKKELKVHYSISKDTGERQLPSKLKLECPCLQQRLMLHNEVGGVAASTCAISVLCLV